MIFLNKYSTGKSLMTPLLAVLLTTHVAYAKDIKIQNNTDYPITLELAHFYTIALVDRSPTISTISLQPGQYKNLSIKPYDYASDIYVPNTAWINSAVEDERERRQERVEEQYSFLSPDGKDHYSAQVSANGKKYLYIDIDDSRIGTIIQKMPDNLDDIPADGIYLWHNDTTEMPFIRVIGGSGASADHWEYKGTPAK